MGLLWGGGSACYVGLRDVYMLHRACGVAGMRRVACVYSSVTASGAPPAGYCGGGPERGGKAECGGGRRHAGS